MQLSVVRAPLVMASCLAAALLCVPASVHAATYTWDGGGVNSKWSVSGNWDANGAPPLSDLANTDLVFAGVAHLSPSMDTNNYIIHSLTFSGASAFTLDSQNSETLTIGTGGITNNNTNASGQTITSALILGADQTWLASSGNLIFSGATITNGGFTLTIDGTANTSISEAISGIGGLTKKGAGTLTLSNSTNSFSGLTAVDAGTLRYGSDNSLGAGPVTVAGGTLDIDIYRDTVGTVTMDSGSINGTTGVLTSLTFNLRKGTVGAILGGTGSTLTKTTVDTVTLSGANTYTGATTVSAGILALTSTGSISSTSSLIIDAGATFQTATAFGLASRSLEIGVGSSSSKGFLTVGGALTYGGSIKLTITGTYTLQTWDLIDFASQTGGASSVTLAGSYSGSLTNVGDVWTGTVGGRNWTFNEATGVLGVVVPEPSAWVTLLGALGALVGLQRTRRRL